jgi:hypothetical protein
MTRNAPVNFPVFKWVNYELPRSGSATDLSSFVNTVPVTIKAWTSLANG